MTVNRIWAHPIEVIGVAGEVGSGKTLFALSIAPGNKRTLIYDADKGSGAYSDSGLDFERVNLPDLMLKKYPQGYKPQQLFETWLAHVRSVPPGRYDVIILDTIREIEAGLTAWVLQHPEFFGRTAAQYLKMSGLMWADMRDYWKQICSDVSARCQSFVFTAHMANVWSGSAPIPGKRKVQGKESLMELASLYLIMERPKDKQGNIPAIPSANVIKHRLAHMRMTADGPEFDPLLPPRLPIATPAAIRKYLASPPKYAALTADERIREPELSADERQALALATAEAQKEAAQATLELAKLGPQSLVTLNLDLPVDPGLLESAREAIGQQPITPASTAQPTPSAQPQPVPHGAGAGAASGNGGPFPQQTDPADAMLGYPRCATCHGEQSAQNTSKLPDGRYKHIGCPGASASNPAPAAAPSTVPTLPPAGTQPEIAPGFRFPVTGALVAFVNEVGARSTFEGIKTLFLEVGKLPCPNVWEGDSIKLALVLRAIALAPNDAEVKRVVSWVEKQKPLYEKIGDLAKRAAATRAAQFGT